MTYGKPIDVEFQLESNIWHTNKLYLISVVILVIVMNVMGFHMLKINQWKRKLELRECLINYFKILNFRNLAHDKVDFKTKKMTRA